MHNRNKWIILKIFHDSPLVTTKVDHGAGWGSVDLRILLRAYFANEVTCLEKHRHCGEMNLLP